ncbi:hypothetical protein KGF54_003316 [Candida jiufengensis]|uniref:uncharacterized protein n=1 Tax=Candida jiufengensis TaxID=497108 RepID=UPI00222505BF|nr:uncharacterized protein KGF54_003316 [Candida jiufengensis]KAI5952449.1 hypothetical protein KGF54_003316 [Candida jiufengensis]
MWPFTTTKETKPLGEDLPADIKDYLIQKNNETKQLNEPGITPTEPFKFEASKNSTKVTKILSSQPPRSEEEKYQFEKYKISNPLTNSVAINCAELEYNLHLCYQQYSPILNMFSYPCFKQQQNLKQCKNLQVDAFKLLHYQDCYNIQQCNAIKIFIDEVFVKNFGELGEATNDSVKVNEFYKDLNEGFNKIWS